MLSRRGTVSARETDNPPLVPDQVSEKAVIGCVAPVQGPSHPVDSRRRHYLVIGRACRWRNIPQTVCLSAPFWSYPFCSAIRTLHILLHFDQIPFAQLDTPAHPHIL